MRSASTAFNLLRFRAVAALVRWPGFPGVFQGLMLAVFIALAVLGWGHDTPQGVNAKLYAKTNLAKRTWLIQTTPPVESPPSSCLAASTSFSCSAGAAGSSDRTRTPWQ